MPKNLKVSSEEIESGILEILDKERVALSIKKIKDLLKKDYEIDISPQIVKRYLLKLRKEGRIREG